MTELCDIEAALKGAPVVPLVDDDDIARTVSTAQALGAGGLRVIEVLLRNARALDGLAAIRSKAPDLIVGAGTVLTVDQAHEAAQNGAQFIVSPGLSPDIVRYCAQQGLACFAGTATPGEVQQAYALGLRCVKLFPASLLGGVPMLKALSSVFGEMRFMPTGGISPANLADYLALRQVLACGGSWLTPADRIAAGDFDAVTRLAAEAVKIARSRAV